MHRYEALSVVLELAYTAPAADEMNESIQIIEQWVKDMAAERKRVAAQRAMGAGS